MSTQPPPSDKSGADGEHWARPIDRLKLTDVPTGAANNNVNGREVVSPMQGFGPLWQKTYKVRLAGANVTPQAVMRVWKAHFPEFQPPENRFLPAMAASNQARCCLSRPACRPGRAASGGFQSRPELWYSTPTMRCSRS